MPRLTTAMHQDDSRRAWLASDIRNYVDAIICQVSLGL